MIRRFLEPKTEVVYSFLRIVAGVLFAFHGLQKTFGVLTDARPAMGTQIWFGGIIELVTGLAVGLGAGASRAAAEPVDPKRRIAVLAFRSGSAELPEIDRRVAEILDRKTSLKSVDEAIVGCAGEAACLAGIGRKLGVAEILLVGVSELGDIILTLQRVDVAEARVVSRIAEALAPGAEPDDAAVQRYLERVLTAVGGRVEGRGGAAEILGLHPSTLRSRLRSLGIDVTRFRR